MTDLIARLEAAESGSRDLDRCVLLASGWYIDAGGYWWARNGNLGFHGKKEGHLLPQPTTSLDAAVTLVPEGHGWQIDDRGDAVVFEKKRVKGERGWPIVGDAEDALTDSPALALCIAALRAMAALKARQEVSG